MRTFVSTIERWPGTLITREYLSWSELWEWESALEKAQKVDDDTSVMLFLSIILPVALSVIKEWHIEGLPEKIESADDLPASPELAAFIVDCIAKLLQDTNSVSGQDNVVDKDQPIIPKGSDGGSPIMPKD